MLPAEYDRSRTTHRAIEFAGGYHPRDLVAFFKKLRIEQPAIADVVVPGAVDDLPVGNDPLDRESIRKILKELERDAQKAHREFGILIGELRHTIEATMDVEIAAGLAPVPPISS